VSRIEGQFLKLAVEIGLAQTIAETLKDVDRAIAELPDRPSALRYRSRLEDQRLALRSPSLRTIAALVVWMCAKDPTLTPRIRRAFAQLAERHPELAWLYVQLPPEAKAAVADEPDLGRAVERRRA
jgi:hypothetical protein